MRHFNAAICMIASLLALPAGLTLAAPPAGTTLSDKSIKFQVPKKPYVVLQRGDITAVVVDNRAVNDDVLPNHKAGYSGVASLSHVKQKRNLFVPSYAGLNFEHIHDGTTKDRKVLFEPRNAPMQLRLINKHTAELYQKPTPHWGLESCHRYTLLANGTIEMTFECIPRKKTFKHDYIGLFWASYIHQPASLDIHFQGHVASGEKSNQPKPKWIRGITPSHGKLATHVGQLDKRRFIHDVNFPLTLAFNRSRHVFTEPWYFGVSHEMAKLFVFRPDDHIRLTQSPSGGGKGNPAWDFQYFIDQYKINQRYQFVMCAIYQPYTNHKQIAALARSNSKQMQ